MMKISLFLRWIPALLMMAVIFRFSAQPGAQSQGESDLIVFSILNRLPGFSAMSEAARAELADTLTFFVRKGAHMFIYFVLALAVRFGVHGFGLTRGREILLSLVLCAVFAASDELHQLFVPGRSGKFTDVLIDTGGALLGLLFSLVIGAKRF